jgi:hypothetical protein
VDLQHRALCTTADGAGDVQARGDFRAAREDERLQRLEPLVPAVALRLERVHLRLRDAQRFFVRRNREVGAQIEELVLNAREHVAQLAFGGDRGPPDERVQLVDLPARRNTRVRLRHARAVAERRLTSVAAARIDPRQTDGLIRIPRHSRRLRA